MRLYRILTMFYKALDTGPACVHSLWMTHQGQHGTECSKCTAQRLLARKSTKAIIKRVKAHSIEALREMVKVKR
jgi:hypothetical protein